MSFLSLLNDTCTIYERVLGQNEANGEQTEQLVAVAANVKCAFQNGGGNVARESRLVVGNNNDKVFLLSQSFVIRKHTHIVEVRGVTYEVSEVHDLGGRKRFLRLDLERVDLDD